MSQKLLTFFCLFTLLISACNNSNTPTPAPTNTPVSSDDNSGGNGDGYSSNFPPDNSDPGYPVPEASGGLELLDSIPNPEIILPEASSSSAGAIGGNLVREVPGQGYTPLTPRSLALAAVVYADTGEPAFLRENSESPRAQLFQTGIFTFEGIAPGEYGLMVDVGYSKFPILGDGESPLVIEVKAGEVLNIGTLVTVLPDS